MAFYLEGITSLKVGKRARSALTFFEVHMSRQPWGIRPSEVRRAVNAVLQTGLGIKEVKFAGGGVFSVIPGKPAEADGDASDVTAEDLKELL